MDATKTANRTLGVAAVLFATLALVAGNPPTGSRVSIDPSKLALLVERELDHVTPGELAEWMTTGDRSFKLIDVRSEDEYRTYHIPGAEHMSLTEIVGSHLEKNQTIILYSEGGVHSAQGMFLLWAQGYEHVFMLKGGILAWEAEVLGSVPTRNSSHEENSKKNPKEPKDQTEAEKFRNEC